MVNLLGREDFVWKRTRASLKKRNEDAFLAARAEISGLREQAAAGQIVLGYLDEAGFCAVHPNRSAWTPVSTQHLIPAIRGQRHNVLAALMSTGHLESTQFTGSMTSDTLIIDNASVHRSRKVNTQMVLLEQKGGSSFIFFRSMFRSSTGLRNFGSK